MGLSKREDGNLKGQHVISNLLVDEVRQELADCRADRLVIALEGPLELHNRQDSFSRSIHVLYLVALIMCNDQQHPPANTSNSAKPGNWLHMMKSFALR